MTNLPSLIERIEKSEGADADLGREVLLAAGWKGPLHVWRSPDGNTWLDDDHFRRHDPTASIDAAMTLVPTGWIVEIRRYFNNDGEFVSAVSLTDSFTVGRGCDPEEEVTVSSRIVERRQGIDPTPLALCACALEARNPSHEG